MGNGGSTLIIIQPLPPSPIHTLCYKHNSTKNQHFPPNIAIFLLFQNVINLCSGLQKEIGQQENVTW